MPVGNSVEVSGQKNNGYAPTFYPGTSDAASAQKVTVGTARTLTGIDIPLTPTRLAAYHGHQVERGWPPPMAGSVFATPRGNNFCVGGAGGPFQLGVTLTVPNVPAGDCVLRAMAARNTSSVNGPPQFSVAVVNVTGGGAFLSGSRRSH